MTIFSVAGSLSRLCVAAVPTVPPVLAREATSALGGHNGHDGLGPLRGGRAASVRTRATKFSGIFDEQAGSDSRSSGFSADNPGPKNRRSMGVS